MGARETFKIGGANGVDIVLEQGASKENLCTITIDDKEHDVSRASRLLVLISKELAEHLFQISIHGFHGKISTQSMYIRHDQHNRRPATYNDIRQACERIQNSYRTMAELNNAVGLAHTRPFDLFEGMQLEPLFPTYGSSIRTPSGIERLWENFEVFALEHAIPLEPIQRAELQGALQLADRKNSSRLFRAFTDFFNSHKLTLTADQWEKLGDFCKANVQERSR